MTRRIVCILFLAHFALLLEANSAEREHAATIGWTPSAGELPAPLSGSYLGGPRDEAWIAGGFDDNGRPQFDVWHTNSRNYWERLTRLAIPSGDGASISVPDGLICAGGRNESGPIATVQYIQKIGVDVLVSELPPLPEPRVNASGASDGVRLYVLAGTDGAQDTRTVWALDLTRSDRAWTSLPPLPGPARSNVSAVVHGGELYVFGGNVGDEIHDVVYRLSGSNDWAAVTFSPARYTRAAFTAGPAHLIVFGADVYAYHTITDSWTKYGDIGLENAHRIAAWHDGALSILSPGTRVTEFHVYTNPARLVFADYTAMAIYFVLLLGIGFYFARFERTTEDFFLGGRRLPWWAVGLSIFGTSLSAITYLAIPAKAFATDWVFTLSNLGIVLVAPFVAMIFVPRLRRFTITTAYEFLEVRFNLAARIYGSLVFMLFQIGRVSIVLYLPALVLSAATGLDIYLAIALMGVITTAYTVLGGIQAVVWTDVLQSVILLAGAVLALSIIFADVEGGFATILSTGWEAGKFHTFTWSWDATTTAAWVCIVGNFFAMLYPATADQTVVQRYLATKESGEASRAVWVNALMAIPATIIFFGMGTALWVFYKQHPERLDPTLKVDAILPQFVMSEFPVGFAGLLISGVFAAAMSSLDSSINSMATVTVNDYYRRFVPRVSDKQALRAARILTIVFGAFGTISALILAGVKVTSLFDQYLTILGLVGGGLAGIFALGVLSTRANGIGAMLGAGASAALVIWVYASTPIHFFLHAPIGFLTSFFVGYIASIPFKTKDLPLSSN